MRELTCPMCHATVALPPDVTAGKIRCGACDEVIDLDAPAEAVAEAAPPAAEAAEPPPPQAAAFPVTPFQTTTGGNPVGLVVPLVVGGIAALVFAVVAGIVHSLFWLVLIFPALHGVAVGLPTGFSARLVKARLPARVGLIAGGCGLLSWVGMYFLDYLALLADDQAPRIGFLQYMDLRAQVGVRLGKAGAGAGAGGNIGYTGTIIYWVVEAGITAVASAATAAALLASPFCEACRAWKRKRVLGPYQVEPAAAVGAVAAGVPAALVAPAEGKKKAAFHVYACPHCGEAGPIDVSVEGSHVEGKNTTTYKVFMTYPGEALAAFEQAAAECHERGLKTK